MMVRFEQKKTKLEIAGIFSLNFSSFLEESYASQGIDIPANGHPVEKRRK
jgi:hypothetical protein